MRRGGKEARKQGGRGSCSEKARTSGDEDKLREGKKVVEQVSEAEASKEKAGGPDHRKASRQAGRRLRGWKKRKGASEIAKKVISTRQYIFL
jgi:hypothetical protein